MAAPTRARVVRRIGRVLNWACVGPVLVVSAYVYALLCCGCCGIVPNPVLYAIDVDDNSYADHCETVAGGSFGAAISGVTIMCCGPLTCCGHCGAFGPGEYVNNTNEKVIPTRTS